MPKPPPGDWRRVRKLRSPETLSECLTSHKAGWETVSGLGTIRAPRWWPQLSPEVGGGKWRRDNAAPCCPGAAPRPGFGCSRSAITFRAGNPMLADQPAITGIFLAGVKQPPPTTGNGARCSISVLNALVPRSGLVAPAGAPVPGQLPSRPHLSAGNRLLAQD